MKKHPERDSLSNLNNRQKNNVSVSAIDLRRRFQYSVCCKSGGAAVKLDKDYAALMLIEILYERKLINRETIQAVREKLRESAEIPKAA